VSQGPANEQQPVRAPAAAPAPRSPAAVPVPGLLAGGNAAMSRFVASLARDPAPAAAPAPAPAAAPAADEAEKRAVEAARAASPGPLMGMVRALAALGADRTRFEPAMAADAQVDKKKLGLAGRVLTVKDAPSTEAYVALGKELEGGGIPMAQRDEVYEFLGLTGLSAPSQIGAFAADLKAAMGWLAQNKGFDARAAKLVGLVDARLAAVGVPRIMAADKGGAHELGKFHRETWSISVSAELGELDIAAHADKAMPIFTTFYHEARHAEQEFQMLRLVMAEHKDELPQLDVPDDVLFAAEIAGPPEGADRGLAESVRDAEYGAGAAAFEERRDKLRGEYDDLKAGGASKEQLDAKYQERWKNYAGQAHEADAFQTEKRLQSELGQPAAAP
jgi:hypothetical protein